MSPNAETPVPGLVKSKKPHFTCGDLFAGAGGLSVGFAAAGFSPLFFNEIDKTASETFAINFPKAVPFVEPIQGLTAKRIRKNIPMPGESLDVMLGGPPCQGFSINAPIRSDDDPRNHLFRHYIRIVLEGLRPKVILLENVPGLVSLDRGKTLKDVVAAFERADYNVAFKILNAAHYGVPQERWRLIFVATRLPGVEPSLPEPDHYSFQRANFTGGKSFTFSFAIRVSEQRSLFYQKLHSPITIREAINDLPAIDSGGGSSEMEYDSSPQSEYQKSMRRGSRKVLNHECMNLAAVNRERMTHVKPGGSWRDIPFELLPKGLKRARRSDHTKRYGRLDPDALSGTILTKCDPHWGTFVHYNQERVISIREAARIQSFPDWFRFYGSKVEQYRQVGNAVPPLLARALAVHIKKMLLASPVKETADAVEKGTLHG